MLHLIEEGELAGHKDCPGKQVQPPHLPILPVDIIRSENLKGLVEPGLLLQPLYRPLQQAAPLAGGGHFLELHAVLFIQPPE